MPAAQAAPLGARMLRPGSHGGDVHQLQKSLTRLRFPTRADGAFGPGTETSVVDYEHARHFSQDGAVERREGRQIRSQAARATAPVAAVHTSGVFPVPGPHSFGDGFGVPRAGHVHQGQDILAPCGGAEVAADPGVIRVNSYQASAAGYYVVMHSNASGDDYVYMHLKRASWAVPGTPVTAGEQIGIVGATGDATGCHLHFEMWTAPGWELGGAPFDPLPTLLAWDSVS